MNQGLRLLLMVHALVTLAAAIVLIVAPAVIPQTVEIRLGADQSLMSYFVAAAELGIAYLSFYGRKVTDRYALRVIVGTLIVFHLATGLLEGYALLEGVSPKLTANILLRLLIVTLFYYFGIYKNSNKRDRSNLN